MVSEDLPLSFTYSWQSIYGGVKGIYWSIWKVILSVWWFKDHGVEWDWCSFGRHKWEETSVLFRRWQRLQTILWPETFVWKFEWERNKGKSFQYWWFWIKGRDFEFRIVVREQRTRFISDLSSELNHLKPSHSRWISEKYSTWASLNRFHDSWTEDTYQRRKTEWKWDFDQIERGTFVKRDEMVRHPILIHRSIYRLSNYLLGQNDHLCKLSEWCLRVSCIFLKSLWLMLYSLESFLSI